MSKSNSTIKLKVQELQNNPFKGIYITPKNGKYGLNFLFWHNDDYYEIYGSKSLNEKMSQVDPGFEVEITYLDTVDLPRGNKFHRVNVIKSDEEVHGFDLSHHINQCRSDDLSKESFE